MWRWAKYLVRKSPSRIAAVPEPSLRTLDSQYRFHRCASRPSLSIWRRKKELGKEGLIVAKELKRLRSDPVRFDRYMRSSVSRLLRSDLVSVLAEFQRQDQVFLSMKVSLRLFCSGGNVGKRKDFYSLFGCLGISYSQLGIFIVDAIWLTKRGKFSVFFREANRAHIFLMRL